MAAPDTIALDCPSCNVVLEIDSGFAGGVCRCSSCGTLMTVPADPSRERAETLRRPASPTSAKSGRPRSERPDAPVSATTTTTEQETLSELSSSQAEVYVTESGKVVRVRLKDIPVARKRKIIRASVYAVFAVIMILIVGLCVLVVAVMINSSDQAEDAGLGIQTVESGALYTPSVNPYLMLAPNVLGLPVSRSTVVVLDAGSDSSAWWELAVKSITTTIAKIDDTIKLQVIVADESTSHLPGSLKSLSDSDRQSVTDALRQIRPSGSHDLAKAVQAAMDAGPSHVILVTGRNLSGTQVQAIRAAVASDGDVRFDIAAISEDVPSDLAGLAQARGGNAISLSRYELRNWADSADYDSSAGE